MTISNAIGYLIERETAVERRLNENSNVESRGL